MRQFTCISITLLCLSFTACSVSCAYSTRSKPKPAKVVVRETTQIVDVGMQTGKEYVVKEIIDLDGKQVNIPIGVTITFKKGGAIVNGTLNGDDTKLNSKTNGVIGVSLKGSWCVEKVSDVLFSSDYLSDAEIIANLNAIQSDEIKNEIIITRDHTVTIAKTGGFGLDLKSNTTLHLDATLTLAPNNHKTYSIISIKGRDNVIVKGGKVIGDVGYHSYIEGTTSEWGMGVSILESSNVIIEGLFISKCTGDGIYVSGGKEKALCEYDHSSKNITIKNVVCEDNRRQGISVIHVDGLEVSCSDFLNTGVTEQTNPSAGIDFEPNVLKDYNMSIRNILITDCRFRGNRGMQMGSGNAFYIGNQSNFENIRIENSVFEGMCYIAGDMDFYKCEFQSLTIRNSEVPAHVTFHNCTVANGDGVCVMIQLPWSKYKEYEKNRDYSILFEDCSLSIGDHFNDAERNGLFYYKGKSDAYDGRMTLRGCTVTIPQAVNHNVRLFKKNIFGNILFEDTEINSIGRPLDVGGSTFDNCTINCDYVLLNTVRYGREVLSNCKVNTSSKDQIMYVDDNGAKGDGFDIQSCYFLNNDAPAFFVSKKASLRGKSSFVGNSIVNDNSLKAIGSKLLINN